MMTALLLTILFNTCLIISSKKCRTNNDCRIGRCEWHRCVGKLERGLSRRMEVKACYVDEDCDMSDRQFCNNGLCARYGPFWVRAKKPAHWQCIYQRCPQKYCSEPGECSCGIFKKCYAVRTDGKGPYVWESIFHIPCINEAPDFCSKATGFPEATCRIFSKKQKVFYVCQLPPPWEPAPLRKVEGSICGFYRTYVMETCYYIYFWLTVRERCRDDSQCNVESTCNVTSGKCVAPTPSLKIFICGNHDMCNADAFDKRVLKNVCVRLECHPRRIPLSECEICKLDEFCNIFGKCVTIIRSKDFDCERGSWFYFYSTHICIMKVKSNRSIAEEECKKRDAVVLSGMFSPVYHKGLMFYFLEYYLFIAAGFIPENDDGIAKLMPDWYNAKEKSIESIYTCRRQLGKIQEEATNVTVSKQRCQTRFILRGNTCYTTEFTNFFPRMRIKQICFTLDGDMVTIMNKEEARVAYGLAGGKSFWLGLKKNKRYWYWDVGTFGSRARYFFWRAGQPTPNAHDEQCAYSYPDGEWIAVDCDRFTTVRMFICQREPYKV